MSRGRILCLAFALALNLLPLSTSTSAANEETPRVLSDCNTSATLPCIESIRVRTESNAILPASLTGRSSPVESEFVGKGYEEYSVPGLEFEGTSKNLFIPRIVYYRYSSQESWSERDFLALGIQPSWLNRWELNLLENELPLKHRTTNLLCGSKESRAKCYRSNNFQLDIDFLVKLKMPLAFAPIWASGSARNVQIEPWDTNLRSGEDSYFLDVSIGTLNREMVLFSDYYATPLDAINASPFADYPADWPGIWIHGSRDRSVNPLGQCRGIPFMSVSTNGIYQEVPVWNPVTESIDLKLYAPHRRVDGELNRGFYELRISEALAKCFWNISVSDKTQARVLISYPEGSQDVVVETSQISFKEGVLEVLATNFTFSSPTIKTKIFQSKMEDKSPSSVTSSSTTASQSSSATAKPPSQKKKVSKVRCVKGSQSRTIRSDKACPSGYKRVKI